MLASSTSENASPSLAHPRSVTTSMPCRNSLNFNASLRIGSFSRTIRQLLFVCLILPFSVVSSLLVQSGTTDEFPIWYPCPSSKAFNSSSCSLVKFTDSFFNFFDLPSVVFHKCNLFTCSSISKLIYHGINIIKVI